MKSEIIRLIRTAHVALTLREFPDRVALMFHELLERQWPAFREAVEAFRDQDFEIVSLEDYCADDGSGDRRLLITFDDNFQQWHRALPLLDDLGVKATFYTSSGPMRDRADPLQIAAFFERIVHSEDPVPLSSRELREIHAAGHTIGCHTHWHRPLQELRPDEWDAEIRISKETLEDIIGEPVVHFSYPFGTRRYFNEQLRAYCRGLGFKTVAEGRPGRLHTPVIDPFAIQRTRWNIDLPLDRNLEDVRVDGRVFENLTGRSPIGCAASLIVMV